MGGSPATAVRIRAAYAAASENVCAGAFDATTNIAAATSGLSLVMATLR